MQGEKAPDPHLISAVPNNSEKINDKEMQKKGQQMTSNIGRQRLWPRRDAAMA
jgi:hypothetical protein